MSKVVISKNTGLVFKKDYSMYPLNKKGNCYFVDTYDKKGELSWSGAFRTKKNALAIANELSKDSSNKKVLVKKYRKF